MKTPELSVIITCYNYAAFIGTCIESLLAQDIDIEIIVVDDCSVDNSREIIASYSDHVTTVFHDVNKGHGAAFNSGFEKARAKITMFLDADDYLLPDAARIIVSNMQPDISMYMYRMSYADDKGELMGGLHPPLSTRMASGNISDVLRENGSYKGTLTSGIVFLKTVLDDVMPMPSESFRQGGDGYLSSVVPLYGMVKSFDIPISAYRIHGQQHSKFAEDFAKRARWRLQHNLDRYAAISAHSKRLGLPVNKDLSLKDLGNLENRIVSLIFEPENHPLNNDSLRAVKSAAIPLLKVNTENGKPSLPKAVRYWWQLVLVLPMPFKRLITRWKLSPASRPKWMVSLAKAITK